MDGGLGASEAPLRVLIVDPDARVRRGLRALLEAQPDMTVIGETGSAAEALQRALALRPSVVLLDLTVPTVTEGLATVRLLATHHRPCVATSWYGRLREAALQAGASGFVEKGAHPESVAAAIRSALELPRSLPVDVSR